MFLIVLSGLIKEFFWFIDWFPKFPEGEGEGGVLSKISYIMEIIVRSETVVRSAAECLLDKNDKKVVNC